MPEGSSSAAPVTTPGPKAARNRRTGDTRGVFLVLLRNRSPGGRRWSVVRADNDHGVAIAEPTLAPVAYALQYRSSTKGVPTWDCFS